jgi:hypothetical protein
VKKSEGGVMKCNKIANENCNTNSPSYISLIVAGKVGDESSESQETGIHG